MTRLQTMQGSVGWLTRMTRGISRWVTQVFYAQDTSREIGSYSRSDGTSPAVAVPPASARMVPRVKSVKYRGSLRTSQEGAEKQSFQSSIDNEAGASAAELAFTQIQSYLEAKSIRFSMRETHRVLDTGFRLPMGDFPAFVHVQAEPCMVVVYVHVPIVVPEPKRPAAAETIVRANYGLAMGRFELNMRDGSLGFRAAMPLVEQGLTATQFDDLLMLALGSAAKYHRAFARLIFGDDLSPAEVVAEVEMGH